MHTKEIIQELCSNTYLEPSLQSFLPGFVDMCEAPLRSTHPLAIRESAAISFDKPKTTALCFDRVWKLFGAVPDGIAFGGDTAFEKRLLIANLFLETIEDSLSFIIDTPNYEKSPFKDFKQFEKKCLTMLKSAGFVDLVYKAPDAYPNINNLTRFMSFYFTNKESTFITPVYAGSKVIETEYSPGDKQSIVTILSNLSIVDEENISWDQVVEFRKDKEAKIKYRRLAHWLDSEMIGKSTSFIEDKIAIRLDDYNWSLKKHGMKTVTGTLSSILDSKFIAAGSVTTAAVSITSEPIWGILAGAGIVIGQMSVKLAQISIELEDVKRGSNSEIAFIHEVGNKLGKID